MKRIGILVCAAALALVALPGSALAQLDHLVCYKAVDKLVVKASADLFAELQPEFTAKGCTLIKVDDFCVPATKLNVQPASANVRPDITGPALNADYIGYLVRCTSELSPSNKLLVDQFGVHRQGHYKVYKIYVPAKKAPPPCGTNADGKQCGGICPSTADECRVDTDGVCKCIPPVDNTCSGKPDKQGQCGGPCADPTQSCQLTATATGAKVCACGPPPPPVCGINPATGTCGGDCPNKADKCLLNSANECTCVPPTTPCALVPGTVPTCGGDCPVAGDVCSLINGQCACGGGTPPPCSQNPLTGKCGGECPTTGDICQLNTAGQCTCAPTPCGSDANGVCGGACPNPATQQCKGDASGACNCTPPSCGIVNTDQCGGECPAPAQCRVATSSAGLACKCQ
ncbi:MAG TPA: hypothetical protein VGK20_09445 [Candidatus Binatia bacterium]|jgi:hypothetical protein